MGRAGAIGPLINAPDEVKNTAMPNAAAPQTSVSLRSPYCLVH